MIPSPNWVHLLPRFAAPRNVTPSVALPCSLAGAVRGLTLFPIVVVHHSPSLPDERREGRRRPCLAWRCRVSAVQLRLRMVDFVTAGRGSVENRVLHRALESFALSDGRVETQIHAPGSPFPPRSVPKKSATAFAPRLPLPLPWLLPHLHLHASSWTLLLLRIRLNAIPCRSSQLSLMTGTDSPIQEGDFLNSFHQSYACCDAPDTRQPLSIPLPTPTIGRQQLSSSPKPSCMPRKMGNLY